MTVARAYYHCPACHQGVCPWDGLLGLDATALSPGAREAVALAAATESFAVAAGDLLRKLAGLRLSAATARRTAHAAGDDLSRRLAVGEVFGAPRPWKWHRDAEMKTCAYLSIDLTGVAMQGPGGAAAEGRMAAVAMVYNPVPDDPARWANPHGRAPRFQARYVAGLTGQAALGGPLRHQANQVGIGRAERIIALSDGGAGLEDLIRSHFPRVTAVILDFYHAAEHLGELARALYPGDEPARTAWLETWRHRLKHEGGRTVLKGLEELRDGGVGPAGAALTDVIEYFNNQVHRMDYPEYQRHGWWIGSGPVESGCKTVVGKRLKGGGRRWGEPGGDRLCHLRALLCGGLEVWESYWDCRPKPPADPATPVP